MIKKIIPKSIKRFARERHRQYILEKSLQDFSQSKTSPSNELFSDLIYGWGNEGFSAEHEYLLALTDQVAKSDAPILECGSGLSTLLLGVIAQKNKNQVWTLEHHPEWAERVKTFLRKFEIDSVELCVAPLRNYGEFDWYGAPIERMPKNFSLVICDGPPGDTRGGRYGLLPAMRDFLPSGCVILADDASRENEQKILQRWSGELNTEFRMSGAEKPFATLVIP